MEEVLRLEPPEGMDWLSLLPEDVQRMVLGFLDLPTLYTARLVCRRFRKFAGEHFKALDCTILDGLPTTDFRQFQRMTYLAVTVSHESHLQSLADPGIGPVVTHVLLKGPLCQIAEVFEGVLMRLPKLRSVSLQPLGGNLRLPLFPPRLEDLKITDRDSDLQRNLWASVADASPLTRCSHLTSLAIDLVAGARTWMETLASLRNLRSLDLRCSSSALRLLSTLEVRTSLTFEEIYSQGDASLYQYVGRLTRLSRLVFARIMTRAGREDLTCIAQLTNLTCLDMSGCRIAASLAGSNALVPLTRLVSVQLPDHCIPQLSMPQIEALHSLTLHYVSDASLLQQTTRLTHLGVFNNGPMNLSGLPRGVGPAVARMSSLRSLNLDLQMVPDEYYLIDPEVGSMFWLDSVLRACTMLTKLRYALGLFRPDSDLKACAALPGLRSLEFAVIHELTPACLPALQAMSGLTELSLVYTGIRVADMTPDVIKAFDAKRRELGWPLLKLRVYEPRERYFERLGQ